MQADCSQKPLPHVEKSLGLGMIVKIGRITLVCIRIHHVSLGYTVSYSCCRTLLLYSTYYALYSNLSILVYSLQSIRYVEYCMYSIYTTRYSFLPDTGTLCWCTVLWGRTKKFNLLSGRTPIYTYHTCSKTKSNLPGAESKRMSLVGEKLLLVECFKGIEDKSDSVS